MLKERAKVGSYDRAHGTHTLHEIALQARGGLRECLRMIELHDRNSQRAFLNPAIVLTAVATWERFADDLACAASTPGWRVQDSGWDRSFEKTVPWPGSRDETKQAKKWGGGHHMDALLREAEVLDRPLTSVWRLHVAASWLGADPTEWVYADHAAEPAEEHRDVIRRAMLGARSARDAVRHRLYYKKARQAMGYRDQNMSDDEVDQQEWCYVWQSDNTEKRGRTDDKPEDAYPGKPTIQHGYARGVVALFLQLIDATYSAISEHHGWRRWDSRLPSEWFQPTIPSGPFAGMTVWNGKALVRA